MTPRSILRGLLAAALLLQPLCPAWSASRQGPKGPAPRAGVPGVPSVPSLPALPAAVEPAGAEGGVTAPSTEVGRRTPAAGVPPVGIEAGGIPSEGLEGVLVPERAAEGVSPAAPAARTAAGELTSAAPGSGPEAAQAPVEPEVLPEAGQARPSRGLPPLLRSLISIFGGPDVVVVELDPAGRDPRVGRLTAGLFDGRGPPPAGSAEALYLAARPDSWAVGQLHRRGILFDEFASDVVIRDTFVPRGRRDDEEDFDPAWVRMAKEEILQVSDRAAHDPAAGAFIETLAKRQARERIPVEFHVRDDEATYVLPPNPLPGGGYLDLAAGMNAAHLIMNGLEPDTHYRFVDRSPYVTAFLKESLSVLRELGAGPLDNVSIERRDLWDLERPEQPLSVIRSKNVTTYVPGFETRIAEMTGWIARGGVLVLQTDPSYGQRAEVVEKLGALAVRLIAEGWTFGYTLTEQWLSAFDTLTFQRPRGARRQDPRSRELWKRFAFHADPLGY